LEQPKRAIGADPHRYPGLMSKVSPPTWGKKRPPIRGSTRRPRTPFWGYLYSGVSAMVAPILTEVKSQIYGRVIAQCRSCRAGHAEILCGAGTQEFRASADVMGASVRKGRNLRLDAAPRSRLEPHASYHRDGRLHMKSFDDIAIAAKNCQPPTDTFRGNGIHRHVYGPWFGRAGLRPIRVHRHC
jgi:hypothetical protein